MALVVQYILSHTDLLEDNIRNRWAVKRPQDDFSRANGSHSSMSITSQIFVKALYSISQPSYACIYCKTLAVTQILILIVSKVDLGCYAWRGAVC
jgi:hypothetical protein